MFASKLFLISFLLISTGAHAAPVIDPTAGLEGQREDLVERLLSRCADIDRGDILSRGQALECAVDVQIFGIQLALPEIQLLVDPTKVGEDVEAIKNHFEWLQTKYPGVFE